jgi:hypothetical protein
MEVVTRTLFDAFGAVFGYATGGPLGAVGGFFLAEYMNYQLDQIYSMVPPEILNCTTEHIGPPTNREYAMNMFRTTTDQIPLSTVVKSICSAFVFRVLPTTPNHCGLVSVDLNGYLYLPFFYQNPQTEYGTYLPVPIEIQTMFPVFVS